MRKMKKAHLVAISISALLISLVAGVQAVEVAKANPINQKPIYEIISIQLPQNNSYNINPISLNFTAKTNLFSSACPYYYRIDEEAPKRIDQIKIALQTEITNDTNPSAFPEYGPNYFPYTEYILEGNAVLPYLTEGWHNLKVYELGSAIVSFYVNTTPTPSPSPKPTITPSMTPSSSPTQQPTLEPTPTPIDGSYLGWIPFAIVAVAAVSIGIAGYALRKVKHRNLK
jgi:hypothetical protein